MKLTLAASFLYTTAMVAAQSGHTECTFGKLFVTDNTTSSVHVIDISSGQRSNLVPEHSITVKGAPGMNLNYAHKGAVAALYRGNVDIGYTDGSVTFIDSGVRTEDHGDHGMVEYANPSVIDNASFDCARAIHFVRHDDKIAIFCDGSYDAPQVNSTVWVVDENKFGSSTESAIVFEETLQGSHHGVAIPVDDDHVLYSLASSDRVERTDAGASDTLPHTFQITDYEGNILHSIADTSSPDTSCSGFHGSWAKDNEFALACDDDHGGILMVNYNPGSAAYTSRALSYPDGDMFASHRTGRFAEHHNADFVVANFAGGDAYHLVAFEHSDTTVTSDNVLTLEDRQCAFMHERGFGKAVMVFMPSGMMHSFVFQKGSGWKEVANVQVVDGMQACSEAIFVSGIKQAFVLHKDTKMLYAVDVESLNHHDGTKEDVVSKTQLDFFPHSAVVGGAPPEYTCDSTAHADDGEILHHSGEHDHEDEDHTSSGTDTSSGTASSFLMGAATSFVAAIVISSL